MAGSAIWPVLAPMLALVAMAAGPASSASLVDCMVPAETQMDMNICADQEYRAADKALNAEYKHAMAAMDKDSASALKDAQRAWIIFRDKACKSQGSLYAGGSMQPMVISDCLARLTRQRTEGLRLLSRPE